MIEMNGINMAMVMNVISPHDLKGSGTIRGMALFRWVWPCWTKYVTVGEGFEVSYTQDTLQCLIRLPVANKM